MITRTADIIGYDSGARFSNCERYRYLLWRIWDQNKPHILFLMMNPSTANEISNDPTVERCEVRAVKMGFGGLMVANVFAWRETDSKKLPGLIAAGIDIVGPSNDSEVIHAAKLAKITVCAWGKPGNLNGRGDTVLRMLREVGIQPHALKINKDGSPQHPLYVGYNVQPVPMG